jgi:hypothetical protein
MAVKGPHGAVHAPQPPAQPAYSFRAGFRSTISPDVVAHRIAHLRNLYGRSPTGAEVLEDARIVGSPLHDHFEWDDDVAAEKWRLAQAKELVAAVRTRVVFHEVTYFRPAFIPQRTEAARVAYIPVNEALAPVNREKTLADIIRRYYVVTSRDRSLGFEELEPLFDLIDQLHSTHCK